MLKKIIAYIGSIILSLIAGGIGSLVTIPNIPTWYESLDKPPLLPPNEAFGPVWTLLYILIGISLARVILSQAGGKRQAYVWFGTQLTLNTLWSITFFGLHQPWLAVAVIAALILSVIVTILKFRRIAPLTLWLLTPYLLWVLFATYLNLGVAILN